jgi:outer membrane receptor for ferric coprogen and ferric-rhodotorulic acid
MKVALFPIEKGIFLIIEDKNSSVIYTNQTNGYACSHPEMKGIFVPVEFQSNIQDKFVNDAYMGSDWALDSDKFKQDIPKILSQLNEYFSDEYLFELDADKTTKNTESWVYLNAKRSRSDSIPDILSNFPDELKAVLTWPNSD